MKRIILVLALLLIAAPAWAAISLNFEQTDAWVNEEDPNFGFAEGILSYDVNGGNIPRAWAMEVELDDPNFEFDWIWRTGASDGEQGYWVTPTQIVIGDGEVGEWGPPFAELEGTFGIIEIASLYADGDPGPPEANALVGITVLGPVNDEVCFSLSIEPVRGGVIDEALASLSIDPNGPMCLATPEVSPCDACPGDICDATTTGPPDGRIDFGDWSKITTEMQNNGDAGDLYNIGLPAGFECGDICDSTTLGPPDGRIDFGDWSKITTEMQNNGDAGDLYNVGCPF